MSGSRANIIYDDGARRVIAIQSVSSNRTTSELHCAIHVTIETTAVVVCEAEGCYALDLELGKIPLPELTRDIPELGAMLSGYGPE
jgi:hypothetical protein